MPLGLLAHPGHQEDVVVDAERDQEDEGEQRQGRIARPEPEEASKTMNADAERGGERQHHRPDQHQRRDDGAQQHHQDQEDDGERDRRDQPGVARGGDPEVALDRGRPADEHVLAARLLGDLTDLRNLFVGGRRIRIVGERRLQQRSRGPAAGAIRT